MDEWTNDWTINESVAKAIVEAWAGGAQWDSLQNKDVARAQAEAARKAHIRALEIAGYRIYPPPKPVTESTDLFPGE